MAPAPPRTRIAIADLVHGHPGAHRSKAPARLPARSPPASEKPFQCSGCATTCWTRRQLDAHVASAHQTAVPFACPHCGAAFALKWNMQSHVRRVHERARPFACARCPMAFAQKYDLKRHLRLVHRVSPSS